MLSATRVGTDEGCVGVLDWGGEGPPVVLLHPNGFCAGLYEPVGNLLQGEARVIALDLPGHGASSPAPARAGYGFEAMATQVLQALDRLAIDRAAVVGGSLGGAVAIMVDKLDPGRWNRALLAEAVAFPAQAIVEGASRSVVPTGPDRRNPMAETARRRRPGFPDRAAMITALSTRTPLSELALEAMDAYARWGTVDSPDGIRLACAPETEATVFEVSAEPEGAAAAWQHLADLSCRTTIVAGRSTFLPDVFADQARRAGAPLVLVDGGHFVLHEDSGRGAQLIREHALAPRG